MSPEYKIVLRVNAPSLDEVNNLVDQITAVAKPRKISARQIDERRALFDGQVKAIYETKDEHLTTQQMADMLEVSSYKIYSSLRRLKNDGEIEPRKRVGKLPNEARELELQEFDLKVKPFYIKDEGKKLTHQQIAEELGVSLGKLATSVRRLKDKDEIEDVRKPQPSRFGYGPKIVVKQELKKLIEENPDKHYTLQEFKDRLGGKITREWVRVLLEELKDEGCVFVTHREHKNMLKDELARQKDIRKEERQQIINEVKKLLLEGYSGPKIEKLMGDKTDGIIHILTVVNMLRKKGEIARKRKPKRSFDELVATDNKVKELYIENLSYREISAITGLTINQIEYSLNRLNRKGEIVRRRLGSSKK